MQLIVRILEIILPILLIAAIGFGYARLKNPDISALNRINTDLLFPLLIFSSMAAKEFHILDYLWVMGASVAIAGVSGLIAWGVARRLGYNVHAFVPPMMFPNVANMGVPLALMSFGPAMLPVAVSLFAIFSLLHVTVGVRICQPAASMRGILKAPMLWSAVFGVIASLAHFSLPAWLATSLHMLGETAIPLGLFSLGVSFARFRVKRWSVGLVGAALRPLSGLLVAWPLSRILPLSTEMQGMLLLYAALPPAVMNYIFAEQYQQNPELVSAIVVVGNIASLVFVPLALYLAL